MVTTLDFKVSSENEFCSYSTNLLIKVFMFCVETCLFKHDFTPVCIELHGPIWGRFFSLAMSW